MKLVYICHPYRDDPAGNAERVRRICEVLKHDCVPLAPQLMLPAYIDEATERELALDHCVRLVAAADEVWVYGTPTVGMRLEIAQAKRMGVPVVHMAGSTPAAKIRDPLAEVAGVARGRNDGC